jgi:hypothetical protein
MTIDPLQEQTVLTLRDEMDVGLQGRPAMTGLIAVTIGLLFTLLSCDSSGTHSGTVIDANRARQIVAEQKEALHRVLALADRSPPPSPDDSACRDLATELGALDIRFEKRQGGPLVIIAYSRGGLPETYETQLTWVSAATAERVRSGRDRLGESFEYIEDGWWWVIW